MYISKWWGNYVGGSDDSCLLLDYFSSREDSKLSLHQILEDLHLYDLLKDNKIATGDVYFQVRENYIPHFDMAIDVLIDLSAIVLESLENKSFSIQDLDNHSEDNRTFLIVADKGDIQLLTDNLEHFIQNSESYEIADFMDEESLNELLTDCGEIKKELIAHILS